MKNFKTGDKVKSRISGNYGIVIDDSTQISQNRIFVKVEFMIGDKQIKTIQKRYLDYVTRKNEILLGIWKKEEIEIYLFFFVPRT